jgi:heme oxygenase
MIHAGSPTGNQMFNIENGYRPLPLIMLSTNTLLPLAQSIKKETEAPHLALEELIVPQIQSVRSVIDYARLLHLFYGFNKPVEQAIQQIITPAILPDIQRRQKADLIVNDLESLGLPYPPITCDSSPEYTSVEQAFGALYVLEGSSLGGKSITQLLLKTNIGLSVNNMRFFNAYGKETGPLWMAFLNQLNTFVAEDQQQIIIQSANETFLKFKHWILQQAPQER